MNWNFIENLIAGAVMVVIVGIVLYKAHAASKGKGSVIEEYPDMWKYFGIKTTMPQTLPDILLKRLLYRKFPEEIRGDVPEIRLQNAKVPSSVLKMGCSVGSKAGQTEKWKNLIFRGNAASVAEALELGAVIKILFSSVVTMCEKLNLAGSNDLKKIRKVLNTTNNTGTKDSLELWSHSILDKYEKEQEFAIGKYAYVTYDEIGDMIEEHLKNICGVMNVDYSSLGFDYTPQGSRSIYTGYGSMGMIATGALLTLGSAILDSANRSGKKSDFDYANIFVKFNEIVEIFNSKY